MATQFISRVERMSSKQEEVTPGPGAYIIRGVTAALPGFSPFGSTSMRSKIEALQGDIPAPGDYYKPENLLRSKISETAFKSKVNRFEIRDSTVQMPGPGTYTLESSIKIAKPRSKSVKKASVLDITPTNSAPSIPAKNMSQGYEIDIDGTLKLQALPAGGESDSPGPASYEPKIEVKFKSAPKSLFGKASERRVELHRNTAAPGPAYYNPAPSSFDIIDPRAHLYPSPWTGAEPSQDFLTQLQYSRQKKSSTFESTTSRDMFKDMLKMKVAPGPGTYDNPITAISPVRIPSPEKQCFSSSSSRFKEPNRSLRLDTAPGSYDVSQSDFDVRKRGVLRRKKLLSRSAWSQNIAFDATESRFFELTKPVNPAPGEYDPKVNIADNLPKQNRRAGPFGSKDKRFKYTSTSPQSPGPGEYERSFASRDGYLHSEPSEYSGHRSSLHLSNSRTRPTAMGKLPSDLSYPDKFALSAMNRDNRRQFRPLERSVPFPPPGAYNLQPSWTTAKGVPTIKPNYVDFDPDEKLREVPGPGTYQMKREMDEVAKRTNRKNVMISTAVRKADFEIIDNCAPGPGSYDISKVKGSLIKPSFNVYLE